MGDDMTTSVVSKTFLGNDAAFITGKTVHCHGQSSQYVSLNWKEVGCVLRIAVVRVTYSPSLFLLTIIITPARLMTELRKGSSSISLPQMQKSRYAYVFPCFFPLFFLPVQLKHMLEIIWSSVVAFPCNKGFVMLEYKYMCWRKLLVKASSSITLLLLSKCCRWRALRLLGWEGISHGGGSHRISQTDT